MSDDATRGPIDDLLSALGPDRTDAYLNPGEDAAADSLLARIVSTPVPRQRWRWRTTFFVGGVLILAGAGVTTAVLRSRVADDPTMVDCYSGTEFNTATNVPLAADSDVSPIEQCQELWTNGTFGTEGAPQLAACLNDAGLVAVMPGDDALSALVGWDLADLDDAVPSHPATELVSEISNRFTGPCLGPDAAVGAVNEILTELGLDDWTIVSDGAVEGECNFASPDAPNKRVFINVP